MNSYERFAQFASIRNFSCGQRCEPCASYSSTLFYSTILRVLTSVNWFWPRSILVRLTSRSMDLGRELRPFSLSSNIFSFASRPKLAGMYSRKQSFRYISVKLTSWVHPSGIFCSGFTLAWITASCLHCLMVSGMSIKTFLDTSNVTNWLRLDKACGIVPSSLSARPRCLNPWQWKSGLGRSLMLLLSRWRTSSVRS